MPSLDAASVQPRQQPQPDPAPAAARGSEYAQLSRQIKHSGLLERRSRYYIWKIAITAGLLVAGWAAFVLVGNSWWQLAEIGRAHV